jgi:hypothetical protein
MTTAERVPLVRDPFGVRGAKKARPTVAAPLISRARISAQCPISGSGAAERAVWMYTAFSGVGECALSGSADKPTATERVSRTKIAAAIRMFTGSPSCLGTPMCTQVCNSMNGSVRIRE